MLDQESWLAQAQALAVGESQRVPHDCGTGSCMIVEHQHDHYRAHCFRCNESGYLAIQASLSEMLAARKAVQHADEQVGVAPPMPVVTDLSEWTPQARVWLYRAGFSDRDIRDLHFYFHPTTQRVVLPVVQDNEVVYWTARAVNKGQVPKYLNPRVSADVIPKYGSGDVIVLTEDILSAAKVGKVAEGWSMLGTKCKPCIVAAVIETGKPCIVWLDPDEAGIRGSLKTLHTLRAAGVPVVRMTSDRDPKLYSSGEIRSMLATAQQELST